MSFEYKGYSETDLNNMILYCKENKYDELITRLGLLQKQLEVAREGLNYIYTFWFEKEWFSKDEMKEIARKTLAELDKIEEK